jgi:hypothetical protein
LIIGSFLVEKKVSASKEDAASAVEAMENYR